ncbi:pap2 superfamily protein [Colletotrichum karsti]|uniref:Pap2 superfamily protein n=1 Tax=Colletotrichum karsti TaxID=1095194 RepID=A0A9P6LF06_9PEZI|nr:pap2 superfamily protein [Colletotrichum karsti]KAF9870676.1 pap2 superfamily protein [Colletotrichum karsti]
MASREDNARTGFNRRFLSMLIRESWSDMLALSLMGGATGAIYFSDLPWTRNFPLYHLSGDVINPELAYPDRGWIIRTWVSGLICAVVPAAVILLVQIRERSIWDTLTAINGVFLSLALCSFIFVVTKHLIGGFRPYFLAVCMPDISLAANNETGLDAVGFQQVMYTSSICTQPDKSLLKQAMTSFPSGHAASPFASFGFLFLYLNAKLKVWADKQPAIWKLAVTMAPLFAAFLMACIIIVDRAHHWYDVVVGIAIGITTAFASFRRSYAAIWDWRYNHIPLKRHSSFIEEELKHSDSE